MTLGLSLYRIATGLGAPLVARHLRKRVAQGKEDAARLGERFGHAGLARPDGPLIWTHAASIGESQSVLPLIETLRTRHPRINWLMTTGTRTSAALVARQAPWLAHQYPPVDTPASVDRFLRHWRPDAAFWVESEIWPNLVTRTRDSGIRMALINGRISHTSARNWRLARHSAARLLGCFDPCLVQSQEVADRLHALGVAAPIVTGDLKAARPVAPVDPQDIAAFRARIGARPLWLAASTHPGDEEAALAAHLRLSQRLPALLTIIAPRHPERGEEIAALARRDGLSVARRSLSEAPEGGVYTADTLGELALWYALAPVVLIGGGWDNVGGHNPLEAAQRDCTIFSGSEVANFAETYALLRDAGAVKFVQRSELGDALDSALGPEGARSDWAEELAQAARHAGRPDPAPLERTLAALQPLLEQVLP